MPNVVVGTTGDDILTGTYGSDIFHPGGTSLFFDIVEDPGGDDYYILESGSIAIYDAAGTDTVVIEGYDLADLNFFVIFDTTLAIWTDDNVITAWFEYTVYGGGIEYLVLDDVTLTRDQMLALTPDYFG